MPPVFLAETASKSALVWPASQRDHWNQGPEAAHRCDNCILRRLFLLVAASWIAPTHRRENGRKGGIPLTVGALRAFELGRNSVKIKKQRRHAPAAVPNWSHTTSWLRRRLQQMAARITSASLRRDL